MSIAAATKINKYLSNLSLGYPLLNKIAPMVCPSMSEGDYQGSIYAHGTSHLDRRVTKAESSGSHLVNFEDGTPVTYRTERRALHSIIKDKTANNADKVVMYKQSHTENLTEIMLNDFEIEVSSILLDASQVTQTAALSGTDRLDNASPVSFEKKIITAAKTIRSGTNGMKPNTIVLPFEVALWMADQSWVKDTKYTVPLQLIKGELSGSPQMINLPPFLKGLKVVIADAMYNNANAGQSVSVTDTWGKNILIGYVPPKLGLRSRFGVAQVEYKPRQVSEGRVSDPDGTKILTEWDYDVVVGDLKCWYLYTTVIS